MTITRITVIRGVLVQDAAYMVAVPDIVPEVPALTKNPLYLYISRIGFSGQILSGPMLL